MSTYYEQGAVVSAEVRTQLTHSPCPQRAYILVERPLCKQQLQNSRLRVIIMVCKKTGKEHVQFSSLGE